jgi:hypothetical protein
MGVELAHRLYVICYAGKAVPGKLPVPRDLGRQEQVDGCQGSTVLVAPTAMSPFLSWVGGISTCCAWASVFLLPPLFAGLGALRAGCCSEWPCAASGSEISGLPQGKADSQHRLPSCCVLWCRTEALWNFKQGMSPSRAKSEKLEKYDRIPSAWPSVN